MVLVDSDEEEERKLLLSDSVTASPVTARGDQVASGASGAGTRRQQILPIPRLAWTSSVCAATGTMNDADKDKECDKHFIFLVTKIQVDIISDW